MTMAGTAMFSIAPAMAQSSSIGEEQASGVQEIIVTAQRRVERIQDVPISISAYSQSFLEDRDVSNLNDLSGLAPNVKIYATGYNTNTQISIRGAVQTSTQPFYDPAVGLYLDGVYIGKSAGAVFDVADLERIEVLNGPQGTLYGRNTLAGAVNLVTQKPTGELGGSAEVGIGNYGRRFARASINLPALGPLSLKFSGAIEKRNGTVDVHANPFPNVVNARTRSTDELNSLNNKAFRLAARLNASDDLTFDYAFDYNNTKSMMQYGKLIHLNKDGIFDPASPAYVGGLSGGIYKGLPLDLYFEGPGRSLDATIDGGPSGSKPFDNLKIQSHSLTGTLELGGASLKSITAYRKVNGDNSIDLDGSPLLVAATDYFGKYRSFSQEFQVSGKTGNLTYTGGLYYFWDKGRDVGYQQYFNGATSVTNNFAYQTNAYAAYGQIEFIPPIFSNKLTLTAGLRYSRETKEGARSSYLDGRGYTIPVGTRGKATFDAFTPVFIAKYNFNEDANIYAKYSRGFKSGGFNLVAPTPAEITTPFNEELVDEYEVGSKLRLLGGKLQFSLAAFLADRKDMQLSVFLPVAGGTTQSVIRNAGKVRAKGLEANVQAVPLKWLRLSGSMGYLDAKFKEYIELGVNVANDRPVPAAPKFTSSVSADVTLWDRGTTGRLIVDYRHSDSSYQYPYSLSVDPRLGQNANIGKPSATDLVNARLNISDIKVGNGSAELSLWVDNLFDEKYLMSAINFGPSFGGLAIGYYGAPRTYGINLKYKM
ncbi:putative TonB-dependent receptor [Caenibius tardaugens NBRC 16725]|uniref:Putative TonB-dependent receptor n=2 Tax=Caenibius TaxID=2827482 RepID=U3A042_9SPHN|nr:putative TonB-dependent receptor [Caenibius tardaugens NBRC 16725]